MTLKEIVENIKKRLESDPRYEEMKAYIEKLKETKQIEK